jgi:hypothetical protein
MRMTGSNRLEKSDFDTAPAIPSRKEIADLVRACTRDIEKYRQWDERCEKLLDLINKPIVAACIGMRRLEFFKDRLRRFDSILHNHITHARSVLTERQRLWLASGFNRADLIQAEQQGIKEATQFGLPQTDEAKRFIALEQEIERSLAPYKSLIFPQAPVNTPLVPRIEMHRT